MSGARLHPPHTLKFLVGVASFELATAASGSQLIRLEAVLRDLLGAAGVGEA